MGDAVARVARDTELDAVAADLRCEGRYRAAGLAWPLLDPESPTEVRLPAGPRRARVGVYVAFVAERGSGYLIDYGWDDDRDRVRIIAVQAWTRRADCFGALVAALLAQRQPRVVRLLAASECAVELEGLSQAFAVGGQRWLHADCELLRRHWGATRVIGVTPAFTVKAGIQAADSLDSSRRKPGSRRNDETGVRRFRSRKLVSAPPLSVPIVVYAPSEAHGQLVAGGEPQRRLFFPERGPIESTDVIVVGGGLAGMTAALALAPFHTLVLERADRVGGTAAAEQGLSSRFGLAAHYQCDLSDDVGPRILEHYQRLGIIESVPDHGLYRFVDRQHYVAPERGSQMLDPAGHWLRHGWQLFYTHDVAYRFREMVVARRGRYPLPTRLTAPAERAEANVTFREWLLRSGFERDDPVQYGLDVLLKSDYGAGLSRVSAFAGLHYFASRPYFTTGTRTFAPPEGLAYLVEKTRAQAPHAEVRTRQMVRHLRDRADHVEVIALDLERHETRRYRARAVVVASPKKALKYIFPTDAGLFAANAYAAWATVTFELKRVLPEQELLCWENHVHEPSGCYIGCAWANHAAPDAPPILTHYLAWPPGRAQHLKLLVMPPERLVRLCLRQLAILFGRDVGAELARVTVQKLGHSMPTPLPGSLFFDPNRGRSSPRIVYAGVDTGRLPLAIEAVDSALEAADELLPLLQGCSFVRSGRCKRDMM